MVGLKGREDTVIARLRIGHLGVNPTSLTLTEVPLS